MEERMKIQNENSDEDSVLCEMLKLLNALIQITSAPLAVHNILYRIKLAIWMSAWWTSRDFSRLPFNGCKKMWFPIRGINARILVSRIKLTRNRNAPDTYAIQKPKSPKLFSTYFTIFFFIFSIARESIGSSFRICCFKISRFLARNFR